MVIKSSNFKCNTLHKSTNYFFCYLSVLFKGSGTISTLYWGKRAAPSYAKATAGKANAGKKKGLPDAGSPFIDLDQTEFTAD